MSPKPRAPRIAIRELSEVLSAAIHDVKHERAGDATVLHFWDADSVFFPIRGFMGLSEEGRGAQLPADRLVQALFAGGFLGRVHLLRPHRDELLSQVAAWQRDSSTERHIRAERRAEFLRTDEVADVRELSELIEHHSPLDEEEVRECMRRLRSLSAESFVAFEAVGGDWAGRFRRLVTDTGLISLKKHGSAPIEIMKDPNFDVLASELSSRRHGSKPLSSAIDAAALLSLTQLVAASNSGQSRVFPRFFTSSTNVKHLYEGSSFLKESLTYDYYTDGQIVRGTAWRTAEYYYLRAAFSVLQMNGTIAEFDGRGPSFEDLENLSRELREAVSQGSGRADKLANDYVFHDRNVGSLAALLEDMKAWRMSRIWLAFNSPSKVRFVREAIKSLADLRSADESLGVLAEIESDIQEGIEGILASRSLASRMMHAVESSIYDFRAARKDGQLLMSTDLAALRWGVYATSPADDVVSLWPERGERNALPAAQRELLKIFTVDELRTDVASSERMAAILLGLERFDLASELFSLLGAGVASSSLSLMAVVARLGTRGPLSEAGLEFAVRTLMSMWRDLPELERKKLVVGYAYGVTSAWERSALGGAWSRSRLAGGAEWAQWAVDRLTEYRLMVDPELQIYAVNQLLYTAARADIEVVDAELMLADLEMHADRRDEFRFLDTVGYCLVQRVTRGNLDGAEASSKLERAVHYLSRARELVPRDVEVHQHWEQAVEAFQMAGRHPKQ